MSSGAVVYNGADAEVDLRTQEEGLSDGTQANGLRWMMAKERIGGVRND